jgi:hypothetical protein
MHPRRRPPSESTPPHPCFCGLALPARTLSVWLLRQDGAGRLQRPMPAAPAPCLQAVAPSRAGLGVAVEGLGPWDGLAALGRKPGGPGASGRPGLGQPCRAARRQTLRALRAADAPTHRTPRPGPAAHPPGPRARAGTATGRPGASRRRGRPVPCARRAAPGGRRSRPGGRRCPVTPRWRLDQRADGQAARCPDLGAPPSRPRPRPAVALGAALRTPGPPLRAPPGYGHRVNQRRASMRAGRL